MVATSFSRERLRRVLFKNLLWYSFPHHHHHHHHHHHLIIIIIIIIIIFPLSLSLAFLFFSDLAQPSSHEKCARA